MRDVSDKRGMLEKKEKIERGDPTKKGRTKLDNR